MDTLTLPKTALSGRSLKALCVFCGSRAGADPKYAKAAETLAEIMAEREIRLIYGGGGVGLMGIVAKRLMALGGEVIGIIPDFLQEIEGYDGITRVIVTHSMHERKQTMFDMCDAFLSLPGGIGTLDETMEMMTWAQLGRHRKPLAVLNLDGYWDPMLALLDNVITEGFGEDDIRDRLILSGDVTEIVGMIGENV